MYHPYFRGKQFELITIRESASLLAQSGFVPIIEPVREALRGLQRALDAICEAEGKAIVIVNPHYGDHRENGADITELLKSKYVDKNSVSAGILLKNEMTCDEAIDYYTRHKPHTPTFVHAGFTSANALAQKIGTKLPTTHHVFFEKYCRKLYRKHFSECNCVLLRDGFIRVRNADYPPIEEFSELHVTFADEGMDGFGDFLIVGDDYSETGGPAYAVAIHLTFIDPDKDNAMFIYHFVSRTRDTPTDPAGKFAEALDELIDKLDSGTSNLLETSAIQESRELHTKGHFPGLGYVKKLSMIPYSRSFTGTM